MSVAAFNDDDDYENSKQNEKNSTRMNEETKGILYTASSPSFYIILWDFFLVNNIFLFYSGIALNTQPFGSATRKLP